jgi:hypothetical protein
MISALATVVTRRVFPCDHPSRSTQPASRLPHHRKAVPAAAAVDPSMRLSPPVLFRQQDALLALLTEIARRRLDDAGVDQ